MFGYCDFAECLCSNLSVSGCCLYDNLDKCNFPSAVEKFKTMKYIENEPPKPNPDLVVVTRCKNCEYWDKEPYSKLIPKYHVCNYFKSILDKAGVVTKPDGYCSNAIRRE